MKEYYIVIFIFKGSRYITLWYMSDRDGFLLNKEGNKIKTFNSEIEVKEYVRKNMLDLQNGITEVFCDETELLNDNNVKCDLFLTFWNIMSDVASSLNINFKGDDEDKEIKSIYNKLFYGCNLPAVKNDGDNFQPKWNHKERNLITVILKDSYNILTKSL